MTEALNCHTSPNFRARIDELALFLAHWRGSLLAASVVTLVVQFAGRDYFLFDTRLFWCATIFCSYGAQALLCLKLEREPSLGKAFPRYMPWLMVSVTFSGSLWGAVPWLVYPPSTTAMAAVSLFNIIFIYSLANAPSSREMLLCAIGSIIFLNASALAIRKNLQWAAVYAVFSGMILFYGLRVQAAIKNAMMERYIASDLAEQLKTSQQRLVQAEREKALLQERQRLMYDMHDGLGSTLLSTLVAIEQNHMPQHAVIESLRECVDDLRLVIDSLEPMEHNLVTLLATIRYRLGPRLNAAGLALDWDIQDLPELAWLEPPDVLDVLRLVQEALVNVLKHSNASCVRVATRDLRDQVEIHIEDNGCGFDRNTVRLGRGLRSQSRRTERLQGTLKVDSTPGIGTFLCLRLPVNRGPKN